MESAESLLAQLSHGLQLVREYAGGQGRTLCVRTASGQAWLLKVLAAGEEAGEVSIAASVRHPAIPAIHEIGRLADGRMFILREHVDGEVLRSLPGKPIALRSAVQQLLEVIAFVHQRGVLHLDLKPGNLVMDGLGKLHLLDFGMAVRSGSRALGGTPFFAAPEVLFGTVPDARADLFSIGAMVVHALIPSGRLSFAEFVRRFPAADFLDACGLDSDDLDPQFSAFVLGCIARRPAKRFMDAHTALDVLCGGGAGRPSAAVLAPDPIKVFAAELEQIEGVAEGSDNDVRIVGGDAVDRRTVAMQLAVTIAGVRSISEREHEVVLGRGGASTSMLELPMLDMHRLAPHIEATLGLDGSVLSEATAWLLARARSSSGVATVLRELVERGELLPVSSRWSWPRARSGRLAESEELPAHDTARPLPDRIRMATARGLMDRARALWLSADDELEAMARIALIEGFLDAGEPSRALPLCAAHPVLRAQALVDTGQYDLAQLELLQMGAPSDGRHRRVAAQIAMVRGDHVRAMAWLQGEQQELADRLMLAVILQQTGQWRECEQLLRACATELDEDQHPYQCASLHTTFGHLERQRGQLEAARQHFEAAVHLAQRVGHLRHAASSQLNLGVLAKDSGQHAEASARFCEAKALYENVGDIGRAAIATANLGSAALARDDLTTALPALRDAAARLFALGDSSAGRLTLVMLARAHARVGDHAAAEAALAEAGEPDSERMRQELAVYKEELAVRLASREDDRMSAGSENRPSRELFRTFLAVNRKLAQAVALDDAMTGLLDAAVTLTGGRSGYLLVMRADGVQREFESGHSASQAQAFSRSLANQAMQEQRTLTGADVLANEELQAMQSVRNLRVRSAVCSPFHSASGLKGAIYVEHPGRADVFSESDKEALEVLADQAAIAVDRMLREEAVQRELTESKRDLFVATRASRRARARLLGDSPIMQKLREEIDKLASLDLPVLIQGETGTGKELVARALHEQGCRRLGPFVAENCSALPAELMERELFGHVKGAFTGADRDRPGLLEVADGGTLFLDEVGDMPVALQVKLLRALQEHSIRRVGGSESIDLNLRMVAATNKNLREMVRSGQFREDLFFRLAAVEVRVPTLRERTGDIRQLAEHFVQRSSQQVAKGMRLGEAALSALEGYSWPGNVRELEHVIARAVLLCEGDEVVDLQLPPEAAKTDRARGSVVVPEPVATLKEAEMRAIVIALARNGGDKSKAAKALGVSRTALYNKIKRHGLSG
ncbi:MAG: transcriptional regulator with GAF, ATPase, and Fis domain [Planctomycetota bacterium]|jgi:transcriptional regulator with GAF, ATPase, and Fis domain/tetratricopeptide (TPR) repeat protein